MRTPDYSLRKHWKDVKNLTKKEYHIAKINLKLRGMRHVDEISPLLMEYFKKNSIFFKINCRVCGSIILFRDAIDGLCSRCARTDLEDMPRRICTKCGKEAHSIEDLDNFIKNVTLGSTPYNRANLCKPCMAKIMYRRYRRRKELKAKKALADRYLRLLRVWGYV